METTASVPGSTAPTLRIFISSPGDVATERDRAKDVVTQLARWYGPAVSLVPVLWEELPLEAAGTFQDQIDVVAKRVDIAVFIVWSKIGTPVVVAGKRYQSGTEREFDLMLRTLEATGGDRPDILFYFRQDDRGFDERLQQADDDGKLKLIEQKKLAAAFVQEHFWGTDGNVRAYHNFQRPVDFAGRLKVHLRGLIDQRLDRAGVSPHVVWHEAPYRGLEVFDLQHATIFFGRELEVAELEQRLRDRHRALVEHLALRSRSTTPPLQNSTAPSPTAFVAVVGASGSGKSSLVRAGLRASLIDYNLDESVHEWRTVVLIPGQTEGRPVAGLVRAIAETDGALPELRDAGVSLAEFADSLGRAPREAVHLGFNPVLQRLSREAGGRVQLLVVIDQFEELFTDNRIAEADREAFLLALEALAQSGWCWVVATMRSDFYPLAQRSETFLRMKGDTGQIDVLPPGPEALHRIITEPARISGQTFEKRDPAHGGQSLSGKILEDAQKQPDSLPLLSDLLLELYLRRTPQNVLTFAAYEELGGLEGALTQRAEKAFHSLPQEQQAVWKDLLHALVTVEADSDAFAVRRRANKAQLADTPAKAGLIDAFISARLFTASGAAAGEATVSLAHEALLRNWERIAAWIRENRQHLQIRSRVEQVQKRWEAEKRREDLLLAEGLPLEEGLSLVQDAPRLVAGGEYAGTREYVAASRGFHEKRKRRARNRRRLVMAGMTMLTMFALAGGVWATRQTGKARHNEGLSFLARARIADETGHQYPQTLLYAARAVGFEGWGATTVDDGPLGLLGMFGTTGRSFPPLLRRGGGDFKEAQSFLRQKAAYLPFWTTPAYAAPVTGLTLTPDGQAIAASYADGSARIWDLADPKPLVIREPGSPVLHAMAFSPDGKFLAGAGDDGEISLWDGGTRKPLPPMVGHGRPALCLAFVSLGDTELIVSGSQNGELRLRNLGDHADITTVPVSPTAVTALTGSASGLIVSGTDDDSGTILVGSIVSGTDDDFGTILLGSEPIGQLGSRLRSMALRPDGVILVVGGEDGLVGVWDGAKRDRLTLRKVHSGAVTAVSFDHTGRHVITASEDGSAKLWSYDDLENPAGRETASLFGHASANDRPNQPGAVTCAVFGPDGSTAATAGADGCVKLWMIAPARAHGIALRSYLEQGNGCYRFEPATQTIEVAHVPGATNARFLTVPDNPLTAVWTNPVADQAQRKVVVTSACAAENWMLALRVVESLPSHERGPLIQIVADALAKQRGAPDSFLGDAWPKARLDWIVREAGRAPWVTDPDPSSGTGFVNSSGMEFVWCPPGNFDMGSPDNERDRRPDETRHKVAVDEGFWIGKFEVTEAQWREVMRTEIRFGSSEGAFVPKSEVTWHDCVDFCDTLTKLEKGKGLLPEGWAYQLPTEVQWEYACRADNAAPFNFGHALNGVEANIDGTVPYGTEKKGQFLERVVAVGNYNYPPNAWGIHDMHGNVWEWCLDPYAYYDSESPVYLGHVLRGGGWDSAGRFARSANRERAMTWFSGRNTGFRVVLAVLTPSEASTK